MKQTKKISPQKKTKVSDYEPSKVALLVAVIAAVSLVLFAFLATVATQ